MTGELEIPAATFGGKLRLAGPQKSKFEKRALFSVSLARLMHEYPNLYSDISSLTQVNKHFYLAEALTQPEFEGRLIYGTDFPLINTALVSPWHYCLRLSLKQLLAISKTANPWDADVLLKHDLGTPTEIFARSGQLVRR